MANNYPCNACGGVMEFAAKELALKCPNCGNSLPIERNNKISSHLVNEYKLLQNNTPQEAQPTKSEIQCQACGAGIEIDTQTTATSCPFCGGSVVLAEKQASLVKPDAVCPFAVDRHMVQKAFLDWIKSRWLAPNALKNLYQQKKAEGYYLPFWAFDANVYCRYTAEGGVERQEEYIETDKDGKEVVRTRTIVDWYDTSGTVENNFEDVTVVATKSIKKSLTDVADNYSSKSAFAYTPEYLAGYGAETHAVDMPEAYVDAKSTMSNRMESMVRDDVLRRYDQVRAISMNLSYSSEYYRNVLLPFYVSSYAFEGKQYQVVIDGRTGDVSGEYPKSYAKIGMIVAAVVILGYVLYKVMH
mgnify:CR=1 FL=1